MYSTMSSAFILSFSIEIVNLNQKNFDDPGTLRLVIFVRNWYDSVHTTLLCPHLTHCTIHQSQLDKINDIQYISVSPNSSWDIPHTPPAVFIFNSQFSVLFQNINNAPDTLPVLNYV